MGKGWGKDAGRGKKSFSSFGIKGVLIQPSAGAATKNA
jgi:hypothetical protein